MTVPETLENLISGSSLVVEGKVRSQTGVRDAANKNIYTVHEIEIFKIFRGVPVANTVNVVTQGGTVGLEMDRVSNALELEVGEMGLFMLRFASIDFPITDAFYSPTEGVLGFIRYDLVIWEAQGVYESYPEITEGFYEQVTSTIGALPLTIRLWDAQDNELSGEASMERAIVSENRGEGTSSFEVHAGVGDELSITGADFGEEQGSVLFPDANSGGQRYIAALPHQIKEWTPSRITMEVPYRAGTGKIRIDKADGSSLIGNDDLPIGYDHINVQYTDAGGRKAYETQLVSDNGSGGYNFQFQTDFAANVGASTAFKNLLETWGCATGVNFRVGETTEVDEDARDGINIVRFDNGDELGGRTLAYARSRYRGCYQDGTIKWFVDEIEVVVNDDYDWYYGDEIPGPSQFDFETVMLHEIGHTQQLGHVINPNEVMHFAVGPQQRKRSLSHIDALGGIFVTDKSADDAVCGRDGMERYGPCCETMETISEPTDSNLCPDEQVATFIFEVDFAGTWKWQQKTDSNWIDLMDDDTFSGTATATLQVEGMIPDISEFRCIVSNACDETIISRVASLGIRDMGLSITTEPATCDTPSQIIVHRNTAQGDMEISTDGGNSFDLSFPADATNKSIPVAPGAYSVVVRELAFGCVVEFPEVFLETECREDVPGEETYMPDDQEDADPDPSPGDTESEPDSGSGPDPGSGPDSDTESDSDSDANPKSEPDSESDPDPDSGSEADTDPDNDGDGDTPPVPPSTENGLSVKVYPNPATERITVSGVSEVVLGLQLFDLQGALVWESVPKHRQGTSYSMDLEQLQSGVYTLRIILKSNSLIRQIVIK